MVLKKDSTNPYGLIFRCTALRSVCRKTQSVLHGSWFSKTKLGARKALMIVCGFASELNYQQFEFFLEIRSSKTICEWKNFCREVTAFSVVEIFGKKIGGVGMTVEVDESMLFRRKNHIGRLLRNEMEGCWIVGGICRETGEGFAVHVPNRSAETLLPILIEHIEPGTRVITDMWRSYRSLSQHGFIHDTVNHSLKFVDPNDSSIHTNTVERQWKSIKSLIPKECNGELRWTYVCEYVIR